MLCAEHIAPSDRVFRFFCPQHIKCSRLIVYYFRTQVASYNINNAIVALVCANNLQKTLQDYIHLVNNYITLSVRVKNSNRISTVHVHMTRENASQPDASRGNKHL